MRRPVLFTGLILCELLVIGSACRAGDERKDDAGWVQLFNGKDLTGWKIHPKPSPSITGVTTIERDGNPVAFEGKLKDGTPARLGGVEDGLLIGGGPPS